MHRDARTVETFNKKFNKMTVILIKLLYLPTLRMQITDPEIDAHKNFLPL